MQLSPRMLVIANVRGNVFDVEELKNKIGDYSFTSDNISLKSREIIKGQGKDNIKFKHINTSLNYVTSN